MEACKEATTSPSGEARAPRHISDGALTQSEGFARCSCNVSTLRQTNTNLHQETQKEVNLGFAQLKIF